MDKISLTDAEQDVAIEMINALRALTEAIMQFLGKYHVGKKMAVNQNGLIGIYGSLHSAIEASKKLNLPYIISDIKEMTNG